MEKQRVRCCDLPLVWQLNDAWFDRLEVPEKLRRHYNNLFEVERQKLESDRRLIEFYTETHQLQDDRTPESLVRRMAHELDDSWLKPGKGRAVDFQNSLAVLEMFSTYRSWVTGLATGARPLRAILPYWIEVPRLAAGFCGPGFLCLEINLYEPWFGNYQDVVWAECSVSLQALECPAHLDFARFNDNPFYYLGAEFPRSDLFGESGQIMRARNIFFASAFEGYHPTKRGETRAVYPSGFSLEFPNRMRQKSGGSWTDSLCGTANSEFPNAIGICGFK